LRLSVSERESTISQGAGTELSVPTALLCECMLMSVGKADVRDVESVLRVINRSVEEAYRGIIPPEHFRDPVLTREELLREFECRTFYAYRLEGEVVGVAALKVEGEVGIVNWVHVLPEHRRKGVGTCLMKHVEDEATRIGLKRLLVKYVHDRATWAKTFYEKLGYKKGDRITLPWDYYAYTYEKALI
jgi:N-acetylglutamate synthase-like GNAT family acetyltransferase